MPDLKQLFTYDDWANRETLSSLVRAATPPTNATKRFVHIIAAEYLWYARLTLTQPMMAVWPSPDLEKSAKHLDALREIWTEYLSSAPPARLDESISYKNSKGESFESRIEDVLTHVVFHAAYHRGQIASDLRAAGAEPAYTDFIHAARTGSLKKAS